MPPAQGKVLAPAKSVAEMQRIVFNDYLDAGVCGVFVAAGAGDVRLHGQDLPAGVAADAPDRGRNAVRAGAEGSGRVSEAIATDAARLARRARLLERVRALRQAYLGVFGIPDYEGYLTHMAVRHPGAKLLSQREFFASAIDRKYSMKGPRCC